MPVMQGRIGLIENLKKQATGDPNELSKISTCGLVTLTGALRGWMPFWARQVPADTLVLTTRSDYLLNAQTKGGDAPPTNVEFGNEWQVIY